MTETDTVLGNDGLRLLDVLLEEEALASAATCPAAIVVPTRHWLRAIAALLGIAVVVATSWFAMRSDAPTPATSPQDPAPAPAPRVVPFDPALLPRVVSVRVAPQGQIDASGTEMMRPVEFREPTVLQRWRAASAACAPDKDGKALRMFRVELFLDDGTVIVGTADIRGMLRFGDHARGTNQEVRGLLLMATQEHTRQSRRAQQVAISVEDLRAMPSDLRYLASPMLTAAEVRAELTRFSKLEVLEFVPHLRRASPLVNVEPRAVPAPDVVQGLAAIPTLREITLHVDLLHADGLRALAALPLQTLNVVGHADNLPARELGELARRLDALRLLGGAPTPEQLQEISKSTTLREFWFQYGPDFAPAAACLAAMPALQRLSLQGHGTLNADEALTAVARTHIRELRLANLRVDGTSLAKLVDLPSLATLELVDLRLEPDQLGGLVPVPQVKHFATDIQAPKFQPLFTAFPNATVHTGQPKDSWVSPFAVRR